MAATIARATGHDEHRSKPVQRPGSRWAEAEAATWVTSATVTVSRDGSGTFTLRRHGRTLVTVEYAGEAGATAQSIVVTAAPEAMLS
jgi:hypothetical protein